MKKVPSIISTKDLTYIEDIFNWTFTACKKAKHYKTLTDNENIIEMIDKVIESNSNICEKLISILE